MGASLREGRRDITIVCWFPADTIQKYFVLQSYKINYIDQVKTGKYDIAIWRKGD